MRSSAGFYDIAEKLIEAGHSPNHICQDGKFLCTHNKDKHHLEFLISKGLDVNAEKPNGETPLSQAIQVENWSLVALLQEHGADINHVNLQGKTVLDLYGNGMAWMRLKMKGAKHAEEL